RGRASWCSTRPTRATTIAASARWGRGRSSTARARLREQLAHYRRQGVELLDIDGGEPTLHPELLLLIRHARALGYRAINVTTNSRLCAYESFAARLVHSG